MNLPTKTVRIFQVFFVLFSKNLIGFYYRYYAFLLIYNYLVIFAGDGKGFFLTFFFRSWRISPGQTRSTNSVSRNIMLHWLFFLARETMSQRKNPAVAQQCRHQPSITCSHYCCFLMCPDSFSGGNKQLKHLLLHCPEHSFGVAVKINHLRRKEGKGINLQ